MDYNYPLDYRWSTEEIIDVMALYNAVEKAYEEGISKEEFMQHIVSLKQLLIVKVKKSNWTNNFTKFLIILYIKLLKQPKIMILFEQVNKLAGIEKIKRLFKSRGVDKGIYASVFVLAIFGIIMIGSASVGSVTSHGVTYALKI